MAGASGIGPGGRLWLLPNYNDDYRQEKFSDLKEYYAGLRREWAFKVNKP